MTRRLGVNPYKKQKDYKMNAFKELSMKSSKRASYKFGVEWIAWNDEPEETDHEIISGYISTLLLADLFTKEPMVVAIRQWNQIEMRDPKFVPRVVNFLFWVLLAFWLLRQFILT